MIIVSLADLRIDNMLDVMIFFFFLPSKIDLESG